MNRSNDPLDPGARNRRAATQTRRPQRKEPWQVRPWRSLPRPVRWFFKALAWFAPVPYQVGPRSRYQKKNTGLPIPFLDVLVIHIVLMIVLSYWH